MKVKCKFCQTIFNIPKLDKKIRAICPGCSKTIIIAAQSGRDQTQNNEDSDWQNYAQKGMECSKQNDFLGSVRNFSKALEISPKEYFLIYLKAFSCYSSKDTDLIKSAISEVDKGILTNHSQSIEAELRVACIGLTGLLYEHLAEYSSLQVIFHPNHKYCDFVGYDPVLLTTSKSYLETAIEQAQNYPSLKDKINDWQKIIQKIITNYK